jgi:ABC-type multidrug transport system ATPase subunit
MEISWGFIMKELVRAKDIYFERKHHTEKFNFQCQDFFALKGKLTCLVGHNGTGKTTFLSLLAGKLHPQQGSIYFNGKNIHEYSQSVRTQSIGWLDVGSSRYLVEEMTVADHLTLAANIAGFEVPLFFKNMIFKDFYEELRISAPITDKEELKISELSSGMKQSLSSSISILGPGKQLILCDESTAHLDIKNSEIFFQHLVQIAESKNIAIIFASHDLLNVAHYADTVYYMGENTLRFLDLPSKDKTDNRLSAIRKQFVIQKSL